MRSIVIHGHFYQPPRENPWLEEVEREGSAAPHHDWNARIEQECYRAVVAARVLAPDGRIARIINTLEYLSFNFGPTLLEWLERAAPDTYARILEADRRSIARLGHGNAIAQPYHHAILPLSSRRDKVTEVRWGIADFRRRFGREPEGMWLPETALDDETLDVLAQEGMRFTIVAPGQVHTVPPEGRPGLYTTSNGRTIALGIYDGDISHGIAFGGLLSDARVWTKRLLARTERRRGARDIAADAPDHWEPDPASDGGTRPLAAGVGHPAGASASEPDVATTAAPPHPRITRHPLVSAATDGETYGHHHKFGEMALARVIVDLETTRGVRIENFASYLARYPAADAVQIVAPSAWSCAHGVERWRSNCGCHMRAGTNQEWRTPLRDAIAALADGLHAVYEREATRWFDDPWAIRDAYGEVVATPERIAAWVAAHTTRGGHAVADPAPRAAGTGHADVASGSGTPDVQPVPSDPTPASLLEMERGALRLFTSCAWFFDDIAGLEPVEVLRYAARAIELAGPDGPRLEEAFVTRLADAVSNDPTAATGRDVYYNLARPNVPQLARVAGSVRAASRIAPDDPRSLDAGPALVLAADGESVTVHQRRTGERDTFVVRVTNGTIPDGSLVWRGELAPITAIAATVTEVSRAPARAASGPGARPLDLTLPEFTERQRGVIADALRRALIARAFDANSLEDMARSGEGVQDRVRATLEEAVIALGADVSPDAIARVLALLDLLELEGMHVPFDVQTRFHDVYHDGAVPPASKASLAPIATRLGFAG